MGQQKAEPVAKEINQHNFPLFMFSFVCPWVEMMTGSKRRPLQIMQNEAFSSCWQHYFCSKLAMLEMKSNTPNMSARIGTS